MSTFQLRSKTLKYYEWDEVEVFLCAAMGIAETQFRNYADFHTTNQYQDFWHVWLWLVNESLLNDSYIWTFLPGLGDGTSESEQWLRNQMIERFGVWSLDILPALNKLADEVGEDLVIHYSW